MGSRPERVAGHTGTETRPRLLREAAVGTANSVPAAAVIRRGRALFGVTGRKEHVGGVVSH